MYEKESDTYAHGYCNTCHLDPYEAADGYRTESMREKNEESCCEYDEYFVRNGNDRVKPIVLHRS
jgi:hypothetical protein